MVVDVQSSFKGDEGVAERVGVFVSLFGDVGVIVELVSGGGRFSMPNEPLSRTVSVNVGHSGAKSESEGSIIGLRRDGCLLWSTTKIGTMGHSVGHS